jgi:hypothetical protein
MCNNVHKAPRNPRENTLEPVERKDGSKGLPARDYSWPPFEPTHGAYSPTIVSDKAREIHLRISEVAP